MHKRIIKYLIQKILFDRVYWRYKKNSSVCISFDDGPHPENTQKILNILKKHNCKAIFFVTGIMAEKHIDLIKEIILQGHEIGNHSYSHASVKNCSLRSYISDINKCNTLLNNILNTSFKYIVRPAYGHLHPIATLILILQGYRIMMWTHDSKDSFVSTPVDLLNQIKTINIQAGDIILLHDDYTHTVDVLDDVLFFIKSKAKVTEIRG